MVNRPPYAHLLREIGALGYTGTARRYGVSDNAIRKWLGQYERERTREDPPEKIAAAGIASDP
jgi:transposase-like protein